MSVSVRQGILRKETSMKRTLHFAMTVLVSCCGVFSFAQTSAPPTEQKPALPAATSDKKQETPPKPTTDTAPIEILTDTRAWISSRI
jgi:hypothetical protein